MSDWYKISYVISALVSTSALVSIAMVLEEIADKL